MSGQITPDTYVLDRASLAVKSTALGAKPTMVVPVDDGGTTRQDVPEELQGATTMAAPQLAELAALAVRVEALFESVPQDIEWAMAGSAAIYCRRGR